MFFFLHSLLLTLNNINTPLTYTHREKWWWKKKIHDEKKTGLKKENENVNDVRYLEEYEEDVFIHSFTLCDVRKQNSYEYSITFFGNKVCLLLWLDFFAFQQQDEMEEE